MATVVELIAAEYANLVVYQLMVESNDPVFVPGMNIPFAIAVDIMMGTRVFTRRMLAERPAWINDYTVVDTIGLLCGELCETLYPRLAFFLSLGPKPEDLAELYWIVAAFNTQNDADIITTHDMLRSYGVPYTPNFANDIAEDAARPDRLPASYVLHSHINRMDM